MANFRVGYAAIALAFCPVALQAEKPELARWAATLAAARSAMTTLEADGFVGSVLVSCGPDVLLESNYGLPDSETRTPSYWIASITKQFTAAAILRLAEQGRLSLDDPISRFFPEAPADKAGITIFELLTHRSGLPNDYAADPHAELEEAARAIFALPLRTAPGEAFQYTNDGYALLGMIVERVSGEPYEWYMTREILWPAGMTHFGFTGEPVEPQSTILPLAEPGELAATWAHRGSGGLRASVHDLFLWTRALASRSVINRASVEQMTSRQADMGDGSGVGFNWFPFSEGATNWVNTRGYESVGYNGVVQIDTGSSLTIITLTHAGPPEGGDRSCPGPARPGRR